jgi:flagellar biosynthesis protein FlhF
MKLLRFTAINMQKAMKDIYEKLGPDALIYTSRELAGGSVEVVAGLPADQQAEADSKKAERMESPIFEDDSAQLSAAKASSESAMNTAVIERLNSQLQMMDENIKKISSQMANHSMAAAHQFDNQESIQRSVLHYHLNRLGMTGQFANRFVNDFMTLGVSTDSITDATLENKLLEYIETEEKELIDQRNICALIGPTGIGKTTTIAKLAKRYISRYGAKSLGLITTDYNDVARKNHLRYYATSYDIDMEYANTESELAGALHALRDKKVILIDTHGASQRDHVNVAKMLTFLESQGEKVSTYMTLPCNVQEQILDEVARAFISTHLRGCILTKQDESISIAHAVSISMNYKMPIAYICTGQNINTDIEKADPKKIIRQIMTESASMKKTAEANLFQNVDRVIQKMQEASYDKQGTV